MGRVLRAYDPMLEREVALKQLKRHRLDDELIAEARAMAQLSHPNVVSVYDVEEDGDGLALVMEYVPGLTLRGWLRQETPEWRESVRRFVEAGRGLAAAHRAGILHRDFKPANVLVGEDGTTKVTDFGLAQAVHPAEDDPSEKEPDERNLNSGFVMGTPRYMAPEQHFGESLTHAADQYGFCVSLWEALCGRPPFRGPELGRQKAKGPPPWPSSDTPNSVVGAVLRGLHAEPSERWPSMDALLDVLDAALRSSKRPWIPLTLGLGVVAAAGASYWKWSSARAEMCTGGNAQLVGTWDSRRAATVRASVLGIERDYAEAVWTRTRDTFDRYASAWADMHDAACRATSLEGTQSPAMLDRRMACLNRARSQFSATVTVLENADAETVQKAHGLVDALPSLARCADATALMLDVEPPTREDAPAVESAREELDGARALDDAGRYDAAQERIERARAELRGVAYGPVSAELALLDGKLLAHQGAYVEARTALNDALMLAAAAREWELMARSSTLLMYVVGQLQKLPDEGLQYWPTAYGLSRGTPSLEATARNNRAGVMYAQGRYANAEDEYRASIALRVGESGADDPSVVSARNNLASTLWAQGKHRLAEAEHRFVLEWRIEHLGELHPLVATSRNNLSNVLFSRGAYEDAEAELRQALAIRTRALGETHPSVAVARANLAGALCMLERCGEGEVELRTSLEAMQKALGADHPRVATIRGSLGSTLRQLGRFDEAETEYRLALASHERTLAAGHPTVAQSQTTLALLLMERDRPREALPLAEAAWSIRQREGVQPGQRGTTAFLLARALWAAGTAKQRARARELAILARQEHHDAGTAHEAEVAAVDAWLDEHSLP